jgi:hypothetical protein
MNLLQTEALAITVVTFVLSLVLASYLTKKYVKTRARSLLFWSAGMWAFAVGVLLEVIFATGFYSTSLMAFYLFIVALLVELLALGSMQLIRSKPAKTAYYAFSIIMTLLLLYSVATSKIGNLMTNYIVWGSPPALVTVLSLLITFPASAILVIIAALTYRRTRNKKMMCIIAGVIFVVIAGTLYIVSFPALLYISEFVGVLLLWIAFYSGG